MFRIRFGGVNTCENLPVQDLGAERAEFERGGPGTE
jgi:hypothetical protein